MTKKQIAIVISLAFIGLTLMMYFMIRYTFDHSPMDIYAH